MLKLLKNLKKTWVSVVVIVILLCVQAWADLTLPDYTSKIVNTGIQAGGIENASPDAIRVSQMESLLEFTSEDETILNSYTLLDREQKYVIKDISKEERQNLNTIMAKPFMIVNMLQQEEVANKLKEQMLENVPNEQRTIMANMSIMQIIEALPQENKDELIKTMNQTIDEQLGTMVDQAAISAVKQEYKELGMNIDDIQNNYIINIGFQMLGIALISMVSAISIMFLSSRVAARLGKTLRDKVFKKVLGFSRRRI